MTHVLGNKDKKEATKLSKHDYSKYSNKKRENATKHESRIDVDPVTITEDEPVVVAEPTIEVELVKETVNTMTLPKTAKGVVANCAKLNVRVAPNPAGAVVCVLEVGSEFEINTAKSTDEWFSICTAAGVKGYCMRKFVDARL